MDGENLAMQFHEAYERLAPEFGYVTRQASQKPWEEVPLNNRALMSAVCQELLDNGIIHMILPEAHKGD